MKYYKLDKTEKRILIALIIGGVILTALIIARGYVMWVSRNPQSIVKHEGPVGRVLAVFGEVTSRPDVSSPWKPVKLNEFVIAGHELQSDKSSVAVIQLVNGAIAIIGDVSDTQSSFITKDRKIHITLQKGRLQLDTTQASEDVVLALPETDKTVPIPARSIFLVEHQENEGCPNYILLYREDNPSQRVITCKGNQLKNPTLTSIPLRPRNDDVVHETQAIPFSWVHLKNLKNTVTQLVVQDHNNETLSSHSVTNKTTFTMNLPFGEYRWYLANDVGDQISLRSHFLVRPIGFPAPTTPLQSWFLNDKNIKFSWIPLIHYPQVGLQISTNKNFSTTVASHIVESNIFTLPEGTRQKLNDSPHFYWRVIPLIPKTNPLKKPKIPIFKVSRKTSSTFPKNNHVVKKQTNSPYIFGWDKQGKDQFRFELKNASHSIVYESVSRNATATVPHRLSSGAYSWHVYELTGSDAIPLFSRRLTIK